jgi:hypothetical protein
LVINDCGAYAFLTLPFPPEHIRAIFSSSAKAQNLPEFKRETIKFQMPKKKHQSSMSRICLTLDVLWRLPSAAAANARV